MNRLRRCAQIVRPSVFRRERGEVTWMLHPAWTGKDGRERYMGVLAKGWYAPCRPLPGSRRRWPEVVFAIGGEDNMIQVGGSVVVAQGAVGVRVPSRWTKAWVYQRRTWGIKVGYIGSLARLEFAYDDGMDNMGNYYSRLASRRDEGIEGATTQGYFPNRAQRWAGWSCYVGGTNIPGRMRDRAFGKIERTKNVIEVKAVPIQMDKRVYTALGTLYDETSGRKRGKAVTRRYIELEFGPAPNDPPQFAGKGENSWDCDDDGIYGVHYETGNWSEAVRLYVRDVEGYRKQYGKPSTARGRA